MYFIEHNLKTLLNNPYALKAEKEGQNLNCFHSKLAKCYLFATNGGILLFYQINHM